jgi:hypothetical protein
MYSAMDQEDTQLDDLWELPESSTTDATAQRLRAEWNKELALISVAGVQPSLMRAIWRTYRVDFWTAIGLKLLFATCSITSGSVILHSLLTNFQDYQPDKADAQFVLGLRREKWTGVLLAAAFFAAETLRSLAIGQAWLQGSLTGIRMRSAARALLYGKLHRVRTWEGGAGKLVNFISNDTQRFLEAGTFGMVGRRLAHPLAHPHPLTYPHPPITHPHTLPLRSSCSARP